MIKILTDFNYCIKNKKQKKQKNTKKPRRKRFFLFK